MQQTFSVTLNQMAVMFIFMAAGYILNKTKIIPDINSASGNTLSRLEMYIFMPALCFNTFSSNLNINTLKEKLPLLFWAVIILAVTFGLSFPLTRLFTRDKLTSAIYIYAFTIPNLGYLGYPLVGAVFGEEILLDFMIFTLPFNLFIYTAGMYILNPKREFSIKSLLNPILISIFAGSAAGLTGLVLPNFFTGALSAGSACVGPVAMILTGIVLARNPVIEMISNIKMYLAAAVRLLLLPAIIGFIMYITGIDRHVTLISACMLALPMGLNNVVFPEAFGGDSKTGAQSCFISNLMGIITVPFVYMLLVYIFK